MSLSLIISWISSSITFGTIILFGALGELLNQKSGNLNLGTPGIMMLGGIGSVIGAYYYEYYVTDPNPFVCFICALLGCILLSLLGGLIYSYLTISLRCNQNVTGLTLTIFGAGFANFYGSVLLKEAGGIASISLKVTSSVYRARIPFLCDSLGLVSELLFNYGFMVYLAIILAVMLHYFLNKTRTGLNLKAVGENPATADACGISVSKYKYLACTIGSILTGLGGLYYAIDYNMGTWNVDGNLEAFGWLSLALVIFSLWKPLRSIWGSYLFGVCYWLYLYIPTQISQILANIFSIDSPIYLQNIYKAVPYIVTIVILIITSKQKNAIQAPSSLGNNYFREDR